MTSSSDAQQSGNTSSFAHHSVEIPRLFNLDLPRLKQTGQALPEQAAGSTIQRILDIASGTGEWAISAAQASPHLQLVGIERDAQLVESARAHAQARGINNVSFTVMDPFRPLNLPDGSFDLVNARYIVGLLSAEAWPQVLQEFVRVTRPGGVLRLLETELPITSSPAFAHLGGLISDAFCQTKRSFSPDGRLLSVTPMLGQLLQNAGCQQTQEAVFFTNFSAGREAHAELCQDLAQTYRLVQPFLIQAGVTTQEEVEQMYQQMLSEMQPERFCAVAFSLTVWGTRT